MKKTLLLSLLLIPFLFPNSAGASDYNLCSFPTTGDVTINNSCVIYEEVNGVSDGNLTISNAYVTLNRTLVFPIGKKIDILGDAIVYMNTGGSIQQGTLCVKDSDHDGYAEVKTLSTDPNLGTALATPVTQIDQTYSASGTCNTAGGYVNRIDILDITVADTAITPSGLASTVVTDREMLRMGFRIGDVVDSYAEGRPVTVSNDNLFVYSTQPSSYSFSPAAYGNVYVQNKVGIGKTNPGFALDVAGTINGTALYVGGSPYIGSQWTTSGDNIYFNTGKVSIGTSNTSSNTNLRVYSTNTADNTNYGAYVQNIVSDEALTANRYAYGVYGQSDYAGTQPGAYAQGVYGLMGYGRNTAAGTVSNVRGLYSLVDNSGGGTITTAYGLVTDVNNTSGTVTTGYGVYISDIAGTTDYGIYQSATNDSNYFAGNTGIGVTNPSYKLQVSGTVYLSGSSRDYKEDIKPLEIDPSKIYDLNPVSYDYKPEYKDFGFNLASGRQFGLIAEEVAKVYPELAITLDRDGIKNKVSNVDYEKLSVILLAEMKNQKKEIDSLRQQVNDLENRLILLEQKLK